MTDGAASLLSRLSMDTPSFQPNSTPSRAKSTTKQLPPHLPQSSSVSPPNHLTQSPTKSPTSSHGFGNHGNGRRRKSSFGAGHSKSPDGSWRVDTASMRPTAIGHSVAPVTGFVVPTTTTQNGSKSPVLSSRSPPRQSAARTVPVKTATIGRGDTSTSRWATAPPIAPITPKPPPIPLASPPTATPTPPANSISQQTPSISAVIEPLDSTKPSTMLPLPLANGTSLPAVSRSPAKATALGGRSRWDYEGIAEDKRIADLERNFAASSSTPIPPPPTPVVQLAPPPTAIFDAMPEPVPSPLPTPIPVVPASPPVVVSLPPILSPVSSPSKAEFKIDWAANDESDDELPALDDEWMTEAAKTRRASVSPVVLRPTQAPTTPTAILRRPPPKSAPNLFPPRSAAPPTRNGSRFPASPTPAARAPPPPPPLPSSSVPSGRSRSGRGRGRAPAPPAGAVFARLSGLPPVKVGEGGGSHRGGRRGGPPKEVS